MPFYDYKCQKCARVIEVRKSMNDDSVPVCPDCGLPAERLFSAPATKGKTGQSSSCSSCSSGVCSSCLPAGRQVEDIK
ncbi:MAG: zinc ribbon domain-containing protein [Candidatus Saganbacteria bacterium]|nr:zinc ribbon domain-containing protein [Candidatus Saganbacteria bacterium]